jgi:hypothetical protein
MDGERLLIPDGYELTKSRTPRPAPLTHRDRAKLPFSPEEWSLIDTHSRTMGWEIRGSRTGGRSGWIAPGFPWFVCAFLRGSCAHISVLPRLNSSDVYDDPETGWLRVRWSRPKESIQKLVPPPLLPRDQYETWVRDFLDMEKPTTEQAYSHMFAALAVHIEQQTRTIGDQGQSLPGRLIHINGLRFRHSGMIRWLHEYQVSRRAVCSWAGTTERTLNFYDNPPDADVALSLAARGIR